MAVHETLALVHEDDRSAYDECPPGRPYRGEHPIARTVARWHDDMSGHFGAFSLCTEQPCEAVRRVDG